MEELISRRTDYRKLLSYQKAEALYDITFHFCHTFLRQSDRTTDQMIQAARSGKQNIVEGCTASATSTETELKLYNVAKASLQELLVDYEDYLRVRGLAQWSNDSPELLKVRNLGREHNDSAFWLGEVRGGDAQLTANTAIVLIRQIDFLLYRHLKTAEQKFIDSGGFREKMYRMRIKKQG